jgi:hypothetical protein
MLDSEIQIEQVDISSFEEARAYGLTSDKVFAVYLHHISNHSSEVQDLQLTLDLAR